MHTIEFTRAAERQLYRLPADIQKRVVKRIEALAGQPRPPGAEKLAGGEDTFRIRIGDYRVIYDVRDDVLLVLVVKVGHRGDVYRRG